MSEPAIVFDGVWKKFRKGERHDSLRDLIPGAIGGLLRRGLKANALAKDEFWILQNVSFEVRPGEALGIIGQNGAGKSTTLKLLTGILRPTLGSARVRGRVGALIEIAAGFHPDLTGRENVYLQGAIMGMKREEIRRHFDAIVAFSGIEEFIDTPVKRYSSGMNARLGFSIAAHLEPDVLLIDEVLAVGDFTFQQKCYERLKEFRRNGTTIAFVSHNMQAVASLCDRAVLLRPGTKPICAEVGEVISRFMANDAAVSDSSISVIRSELSAIAEGANIHAVTPGSRLRLDFTIRSIVALPRCGIGLRVVRSDGLLVFHGSSNVGGTVDVSIEPGMECECSIEFDANLLRGTYAVGAQLIDTRRLWPAIEFTLGSFVISETNRIAGCAELSPRYMMTPSELLGRPGTGSA